MEAAKLLDLEAQCNELREQVRILEAKLKEARTAVSPPIPGGRLWVSSPCTKYDEWSYSTRNSWYTACPCCRRPLEVGVLGQRPSLVTNEASWKENIEDGFEMKCTRSDMGAIFPSSYCYDVVREVAEGEIVVASAKPETVSGFTMVPVRPQGWIDARFFEPARSTNSDDEATTDIGMSSSSATTGASPSEDAAEAVDAAEVAEAAPMAPLRHAYSCALWGAGGGYALGAWILGQRLKELTTEEDPVDRVLIHTDDLPPNYLKLLSEVWILHKVDYIDGVEELYSVKGTAFDGVFTKLAAWSLVQYDKVLLLDIDIVLLKSPVELFNLEPPAAMVRGSGSRVHGDLVSGTMMFRAEDDVAYPFGQGGGINAGVILLAPSQAIFDRMLKEVRCKSHPAHIRGNGPEQDYLSRFFAWTPWRHIDVSWNYQVHHVPFAVEHVLSAKQWALAQGDVELAESPQWLPQRLTIPIEDISIVHFSGDVKPWHLYLDAKEDKSQRRAVEHVESPWLEHKNLGAFSDHLLASCCGGYRLWISLEGSCSDYHKFGICRRGDGAFYLENKLDVSSLVLNAKNRVVDVTRRAMECFVGTADRVTMQQLKELRNPTAPKPHCFLPGSRVAVLWMPEKIWGEEPPSDGEDEPGERPRKILKVDSHQPELQPEDLPLTGNACAPAAKASGRGLDEATLETGGAEAATNSFVCSCTAAMQAEARAYADASWWWSAKAEPAGFHCPATVVSVHSTGRYVIRFDNAGSWGDTERHVAHCRVRPLD
mmetsp:Transcript_16187/g.35044  ORF Transcript_16187/g.35044 Transcript_16187/m.35044 type:complete len:767 (+) Transcript_16187:100-2400(+)